MIELDAVRVAGDEVVAFAGGRGTCECRFSFQGRFFHTSCSSPTGSCYGGSTSMMLGFRSG